MGITDIDDKIIQRSQKVIFLRQKNSNNKKKDVVSFLFIGKSSLFRNIKKI